MSTSLDITALTRDKKIIVCCGSGGVGKTTAAAAMGVLAATQGRSALVMTIDPAHRLAQAMGLDGLSNDPQRVDLDAPGSLHAMMLDSKRTFDRLVESYAANERIRDTIFANNYYQQMSSSLGGSKELIAMERVFEIASAQDYDLLIVDTPPAQRALDFLDAPKRMIDLLDGTLTGLLLKPYGLAARMQFGLFRESSAVTMKFLERLTGFEILTDLSDFMMAFSSMFDGFKDRSHKVMELMRGPGTSFVLVCAPARMSLGQADQFAARLTSESISIAGVLVNRVHLPFATSGDLADADLISELAPIGLLSDKSIDGLTLIARVTGAYTSQRALVRSDRAALKQLRESELPSHLVPHFNRDLHNMEDMEKFAAALYPYSVP
ncbi:MAG: AAA family ATPase [Gammaproteobacteria bacterium]|nr:AAA family ATPase [Gammaproteobacteria bacterium]